MFNFATKTSVTVIKHQYCRKCGSEHIVKSGRKGVGNRKDKCKAWAWETRLGLGGVFQMLRRSEDMLELDELWSSVYCSEESCLLVYQKYLMPSAIISSFV